MTRSRHIAVLCITISTCVLFFASQASAEPVLLAEWLIKGTAVTASTSTLTTGISFVFSDKTFGAVIECTGKMEGTVNSNGTGSVTRFLSLNGSERNLSNPFTAASKECVVVEGCTAGDPVEFAPDGLPVDTQLVLSELSGKFYEMDVRLIYSFKCTILGIKTTDECTVEDGRVEAISAVEGAELKGTFEPLANCSVGGKESGEFTFKSVNHLQNLAGEAVDPSSGA